MEQLSQVLPVSWSPDVVGKDLGPEEVSTKVVLNGTTHINLFSDRPRDKLEEIVFLSPLLSEPEEAHDEELNTFTLLLSHALVTELLEQACKILGLGLKDEEEFLVMLQLLSRVLVQCSEIKGIFGSQLFVGQKVSDMATEMSLVLYDFVKSDLIPDEEGNLDVELIDVLLSHLILADVLNNRLPQALELCSPVSNSTSSRMR